MGANPVSSRAGAAVAVQPAARRIGTTDATFVAGFKAWLALGYCAKKGERAIAIIAPLPIKDRDRISGEETGETRLLFKTVFVFDRSQVAPLPTGTPTLLEPPCEPLTGESHARLIAPLVAFAESLGYTVSFEPVAGAAGGWCDHTRLRIAVDADAPGNARLRTLVHEVAHALGVGYAEYGRARAEVIVDTTIFCPSRPTTAAAPGLSLRDERHRRRRGCPASRRQRRSDLQLA